jgi:hypothetical protein
VSRAAAPAVPRRAAPASAALLDRFLAVVPLLAGVLTIGILYAWLAWEHKAPWLFTDELEMTQISRAIAETGHPARRGVAYQFTSLVPFFTAPAWLVHDTRTAYDLAKYIGVAAMVATALPTYWLARTIVPPRYALFAALGAVGVPALAYSSQLLEEPFAYPAAALAFFLFAKALATRRPLWIAGGVLAAIAVPQVRDQLRALTVAFVLATLLYVWSSERVRAWRSRWTPWDVAGALILVALAVVVVSGALGSYTLEWLITTRYYKGRLIEYGLWAGGALTIGLGILPVVVGLAALVRPRGETRTPELRAFRSVFAAGLACIALYAGIKAAYLSTIFSTLTEERNLIYVAPLFFVGTAWWLHGRRLRTLPLLASIGFVAYLLVTTPYQMQLHLYFEAYGFAILQMLNRQVALDVPGATWLLCCMLGIVAAVTLAPRVLRGRRARAALPGVAWGAALLAVAWGIAGGVSAGTSSNSFSNDFVHDLPANVTWLDDATGGRPALFLGQGIRDPNGIHQLEFWNRSLKQVWSLDGTAPQPGPILTPDLAKPTGELYPDPGYPYVVVGSGVDVVGQVVAAPPPIALRLIRVAAPLRLRSAETGVEGDGWINCDGAGCTAKAAYSRFSTPGNRGGFVEVTVSRKGWTGPQAPGNVTVRVGTLVVGPDRQPALGEVLQSRTWVAASGVKKVFTIPAPAPPFRVEIESETFSPSQFGASDTRNLGIQPGFAYTTVAAPDREEHVPGF